ncbi:ABC-type glutathione transport system ATPase component [Microbacterium sp. ZKA21]|uniref:ATP-binding cassette domain-containing protein n=1 Tax=Microbacterium sp. ZKA21 TaxID=3381694 RepID=UPI003D20F8A5
MNPVLEARDLEVEYRSKRVRAKPFQALRGVSIEVRAGETLGLVGESGSGKTTLGRAILGLAPVAAGSIVYDGRDITRLRRAERRELGREIQAVFQDPYSSLSPSMTIESILTEPLAAAGASKKDARAKVLDLLDRVGLPSVARSRLPREFSGGQRQRIAIARALALDPRVIVCDEPVSALDLSTQERVLDLFIEIQERAGVAYLFISHDLSVVRHISHRVAVMHRGEIVETGSGDQVTSAPMHPYTQRLFLAAPVSDPDVQRERRQQRRDLVLGVGRD